MGNEPSPSVQESSVIVGADYGPDGHRYNDDLLLDENTRKAALQRHAPIFHVLDSPLAREHFVRYNRPANQAKRASQAWGAWAVALALLSLFGGSSESLWGHFAKPWPDITVIVSAAAGLIAILVAWKGVLFGARKREWLRNRVRTERIRQFHFQEYVAHFDRVAASVTQVLSGGKSADLATSAYARVRDDELKAFVAAMERPESSAQDSRGNDDAYLDLEQILAFSVTEGPPVWVHDGGKTPARTGASHDPKALGAMFAAYDAFRFQEQLRYCEYVLRDQNEPAAARDEPKLKAARNRFALGPWYPGMTQPLKVRRAFLGRCWTVAMIVLIGLHLILMVSPLVVGPTHFEAWLHVGVVWSVLTAVAAKTLAEGFAVTREIQRYEEYRAVVAELHREFQRSNISVEQRFELMMRMERASFEEMREFIRANLEAHFVM